MSTPLLTTKLFAPPLHPVRVTRSRLLQRLDQGLSQGHCLALISAPAGYGKTTLVVEWLEQLVAGRPPSLQGAQFHAAACWLSVDEGDNDPVRFWRYVTAAVQTSNPAFGQTFLPMLEAPRPPPVEAIVTALINEVVGIPKPLLLLLDDYHAIKDLSVHESLNFFLDHLSKGVMVVVTSREDPPLSLSRWRGRRQITEIRAADLRFTPQETGEFLNTVMGLDLPSGEVLSLENRTEGWVVGLQMAAIALQTMLSSSGQPADSHQFVSTFAGNDLYIADYLIEEVLLRQPAHIQEFLMRTSILERLCGALCDELLRDKGKGLEDLPAPIPNPLIPSNSQSLLENLERANLFLIPLDHHREWYRYHHLFADLLRQRLHKIYGAQAVETLHRRASRWFGAHGLISEAIFHALEGLDFPFAGQLIEQHAKVMFISSELITLVRWIQSIPEAERLSHPRLLMIEGWAALASGQVEIAEQCLLQIEQCAGATVETLTGPEAARLTPEVRSALVEVAVLRAQFALGRFDFGQTIDLSHRILEELSDPKFIPLLNSAQDLKAVIVFTMGLAYEITGELNQAGLAFEEAAIASQAQGNNQLAVLAISHLGHVRFHQGSLRQSEVDFRRALEIDRQMSTRPSPFSGIALAGLGNTFYEWNDIEQSLQYFQESLTLARPWRNWEGLLPALTGLARLKGSRGDWQGAQADLEELGEIGRSHAQIAQSALEPYRGWLDFAQGRLEAAAQWANNYPVPAPPFSYPQLDSVLLYARIQFALGRLAEAVRLAGQLLETARACGAGRRVIEIRAFQAVIYHSQGQKEPAQEALYDALSLAAPEGFLRIFLSEGEPLYNLLIAAYPTWKDGDPISSHGSKLARLFEQQGKGSGHIPIPGPRLQPAGLDSLSGKLTGREIDVLRLIAEGLTNNEIAGRLFISLTTVKTHTSNIYSKFGVNSRTQAMARARELGYL